VATAGYLLFLRPLPSPPHYVTPHANLGLILRPRCLTFTAEGKRTKGTKTLAISRDPNPSTHRSLLAHPLLPLSGPSQEDSSPAPHSPSDGQQTLTGSSPHLRYFPQTVYAHRLGARNTLPHRRPTHRPTTTWQTPPFRSAAPSTLLWPLPPISPFSPFYVGTSPRSLRCPHKPVLPASSGQHSERPRDLSHHPPPNLSRPLCSQAVHTDATYASSSRLHNCDCASCPRPRPP